LNNSINSRDKHYPASALLHDPADGPCADLAGLSFRILDSPIDRCFDQETTVYAVEAPGINILVTRQLQSAKRLTYKD
jgi:hypothetical protein